MDVLFVCTHNAGRSQMAAALLERMSEGRLRVHSAGTEPAERLHPPVVEVMREIGIDLASARPAPLRDEAVQAADAVITMGCGDTCPVYPGKRYEDWDLADPAGRPVEEVREIRDQIELRVKELLDTLS
ncbi:MAG: arsenate reductase ArsC [Actinomycetota bacterium]